MSGIDNILEKDSKFLTFALGGEDYGLEILKVREIMGIMKINSIPQLPDYVKGVINLRDKVIPVIDLRLKFGMEPREYDSETCIIVVMIKDQMIGIIVDKVSEVVDVKKEMMEEAPDFGESIKTDFILAMAKVGEQVIMLLDINDILTKDAAMLAKKKATV